MSANATLLVDVTDDVRNKLQRLAADTKRSEAAMVREAVADYVQREADIMDAIRRGLADVEAGRVVPHDEAMAEIDAIVAAAQQLRA